MIYKPNHRYIFNESHLFIPKDSFLYSSQLSTSLHFSLLRQQSYHLLRPKKIQQSEWSQMPAKWSGTVFIIMIPAMSYALTSEEWYEGTWGPTQGMGLLVAVDQDRLLLLHFQSHKLLKILINLLRLTIFFISLIKSCC